MTPRLLEHAYARQQMLQFALFFPVGVCGQLFGERPPFGSNCKERLAKRFWPFDWLMSVLGYSSQMAKFNLTLLVKLKNIIHISITDLIHQCDGYSKTPVTYLQVLATATK